MRSIAVTPSVVQDIVDNADERELYIVSKEMEREPYWFAHEGLNARLAKALRRCLEGGIERLPSGDHVVQGSAGRLYVVKGTTCECPASQKGKSSWCYHSIAVVLYTEWQRRVARGIQTPVALGTLRAGTLPLAPVTIEERLAPAASVAMDHVSDALVTPQEDRMDTDDTPYIPEQGHATTAVLDASDADFPPMGQPATRDRPLPGPVLLPSLDARTLEQSMQAFAAQRAVVTRYIKEQMTEGVDYYTLTIKGRVSKATLSKAGSEKFLSLFQLHAAFQQDQATWQMLGSKDGLLCYTCTLMTRSGEVIGEGRGARSVSQDGGDINKAIKMATKSAQVDAVLRTGALSDVFTQDLDDTPAESVKAAEPVKAASMPSADLRKRIWAQVNAQAKHITTQDDARAWVQERTGLAMEPDQYAKILAALEAHA